MVVTYLEIRPFTHVDALPVIRLSFFHIMILFSFTFIEYGNLEVCDSENVTHFLETFIINKSTITIIRRLPTLPATRSVNQLGVTDRYSMRV